MQISALQVPARSRPSQPPPDPIVQRLEDRYDQLTGKSVLAEEIATWTSALVGVVTFGSMPLRFEPVLATLGPIGTPGVAAVAIFAFAWGAQRIQKREAEKTAIQLGLEHRRLELACQAEQHRQEIGRMANPGSAAVDERGSRVTIGSVRVEKR